MPFQPKALLNRSFHGGASQNILLAKQMANALSEDPRLKAEAKAFFEKPADELREVFVGAAHEADAIHHKQYTPKERPVPSQQSKVGQLPPDEFARRAAMHGIKLKQ